MTLRLQAAERAGPEAGRQATGQGGALGAWGQSACVFVAPRMRLQANGVPCAPLRFLERRSAIRGAAAFRLPAGRMARREME